MLLFRGQATRPRRGDTNLMTGLVFSFLLLISCWTDYPRVAASEVYSETSSIKMESDKDSHHGLFESLWKTIKQTMEMTSSEKSKNYNSESFASSEAHGVEDKLASQRPRETLFSRRIALFQQTLQSHYTKRLLDSSPHFRDTETHKPQADLRDYNYRDKLPSPTVEQANENAVRWTRNTGVYGRCLYFRESPNAYWSFQWCPQKVVVQGLLSAKNDLDIQHSLGSYLPLTVHTTVDASAKKQPGGFVLRFAEHVQMRYPKASLQLYHDGDECDLYPSGSHTSRRITVVVIHDESSHARCGTFWTGKPFDLVIESIEEPQICRYIVHVCKPNIPTSKETVFPGSDHRALRTLNSSIAKFDVLELNRTITHIEQSLNHYLHQTTADAHRKSNPDRTTSLHMGLPPLPDSRIHANLKLIKNMFMHAYDSYMYNAFPASEVRPMTCQPASFDLVKIPGLTLIDALDTLIVLGNYTEFARATERLRGLHQDMKEEIESMGLFALNQNVSVFETNIRVLGGLLSAHQMADAYLQEKVLEKDVWSRDYRILHGSENAMETCLDTCVEDDHAAPESSIPLETCGTSSKVKVDYATRASTGDTIASSGGNQTERYWTYDGFLLDLAQDIGNRLLVAFSTKTGIPYGTVNLLSGVPRGETTIASLAGAGTLSLEMELLSRLTGNPKYGNSAKLAARALWMRRSKLNLLGKHICTSRGEWTESLSGIGSNSDSFYEYLIKHYILFPEDHDFWLQLVSSYGGVYNESRLGEWYGDVDYHRGQSKGGNARKVFEALMAFYPGMQVLLGELTPAARSLNSFFLVREYLGFLPERFSYASWRVDGGGGEHFLRPELLESAYFLHRATSGFQQQFRKSYLKTDLSSGWQWAADFALHTLEESTRSICGYASLRNLSPSTTGAIGQQRKSSTQMQTNLMNDMPSFFLSETLKYLYLTFDETNVLHTDRDRDWVFTTEAHPIHHVNIQQSDGKTDRINQLKRRLLEKIKAKADGVADNRASISDDFEKEKWTVSSPAKGFQYQVSTILNETKKTSISKLALSRRVHHGPNFWSVTGLIESILTPAQVSFDVDFFREAQQRLNAAHLTFSKLGNEQSLTNSCPNFHLSDFRWIRALNGGAVDYSEVYISSAVDKPSPHESRFQWPGSMDALAVLGSGTHIGEEDDSNRCPLVKIRAHNLNKNSSRDKHSAHQEETEQVHSAGDLGDFEVSSFPGGAGFYVRHIDSGETIISTIIHEESSPNSANTFMMVYATMPDGDSNLHIEEKANFEKKIGMEDSLQLRNNSPSSTGRSVVMADLLGVSFQCKVMAIEVPADETKISKKSTDGRVVAVYPCAPAMFGPAHMLELTKSGGISVEATIRTPDLEKKRYGCHESSFQLSLLDKSKSKDIQSAQCEVKPDGSSEGFCSNRSVNLVHRGVCTFQEKSITQKEYFNADAVIVINSDEEELFVMSGGDVNGLEHLDDLDFPPTVLITGRDGEDLVSLASGFSDKVEHKLNVRVSLIQDEARIVETSRGHAVQGNKFWPAVRANSGAFQIFASGGWGVHAVQRDDDSRLEWQLYLVRHELQPA